VSTTQRDLVLDLLAGGRWHSTVEFIDLGIPCAGARAHELRSRGFAIETRRTDRRGSSPIFHYRLHREQQLELLEGTAA
jgi:Helix-turn-helix domain